jgi:hypothetical protein
MHVQELPKFDEILPAICGQGRLVNSVQVARVSGIALWVIQRSGVAQTVLRPKKLESKRFRPNGVQKLYTQVLHVHVQGSNNGLLA